MDYFVKCKSCHRKIMIDRDEPEGDTVMISGDFANFPSCPHCGADHQYGPSDVHTEANDS